MYQEMPKLTHSLIWVTALGTLESANHLFFKWLAFFFL